MCNLVVRRYGRLIERMQSRAATYHIDHGDSLLLTEAIEAIQLLEGELDSERNMQQFREVIKLEPPPVMALLKVGARAYMMNGCRIIIADEPDGWHLSISRKDRDPTWDEIATARYRLLPDVPEMKMVLPPLDEYVNLALHCFHLHEERRSELILP